MGGISGRVGNLNSASQRTITSGASKDLSPHITAKTDDKSTFLGKNGLCDGISDVVNASVDSEKIGLKKSMMIMIIKRQWFITEKPFTKVCSRSLCTWK